MNATILRLCCLFVLATTAHAGLVSWWTLDNTAEDRTGHHPGRWIGTPTYTVSTSAPGSAAAATFSDSSNARRFVRAGTGIDFTGATPFSAMAWLKGGSDAGAIIGDLIDGGSYTGWELHVGTLSGNHFLGGPTVWLIHQTGGNFIQVNGAKNVLDGAWHHVAFTYDGSRTGAGVKIYVDGLPVPTAITADSLTGSIANGELAELHLGSRQSGTAFDYTFSGALDEAAIFDHLLTPGEIAYIHAHGLRPWLATTILNTFPGAGEAVPTLTSVEVEWTFDVTGVEAADLLVAGVPASAVTRLSGRAYRFTFAQPAAGPVGFSWVAKHGIQDDSGRLFDGAGFSITLDPTLPPLSVAITEFMAQNAGGIEDAEHDSPDWIEVANQSFATVNLAGWTLTDRAASPKKWTFPPNVSLGPGERRVVFASNKNRAGPGQELHANFKLSREGGFLALLRPDGTVAHAYDGYPLQEANVSFGLTPGARPETGTAGWRYFRAGSPGLANFSRVLGSPAIRSVTHQPEWPGDAEDITVTAEVAPVPGAITKVTLYYRVQFEPEVALPMAAVGERYEAVIPAGASTAGQMVRWRVAVKAGGLDSCWPLNTDPRVPLPCYLGTTVRMGGALTPLPLYEVFVPGYFQPPKVRGPYHLADSSAGARGAFAWQGVLYDNVFFRRKGTTSIDLYKRSHRVDFNPGHEFAWSPTESTKELSLNAEYPDPSYARQYLSLWMQRAAGVGGAPHFPVRVHMNGVFWQLAFHTLPADQDLLHFMGLSERGVLYKQAGEVRPNEGEKENRRWEDNADFNAFANAIGENNANRFVALYDVVDLPATINYLAVARLTHEADDVWANMVLYRDSEGTREWRPIPFDLNLSFGQLYYDSQPWNTAVHATMDNLKSHPLHGSSVCRTQYPGAYYFNTRWNRLYDVIIQHPETRAMLLRRMRTLLDRFYKPPGTPYAERPIEAELDAVWARIQAAAELDRQVWGFPPYSGVYGLGPVPPAQAVADLKNLYLEPRRTHLYLTHSVHNTARAIGLTNLDNAGIPDAQPVDAVVEIVAAEFAPASNNQDQEFVQLLNRNGYAVDVGDWKIGGGISQTIKPGTVLPAGGALYLSPDVNAFRARTSSPRSGEKCFVQGNYGGHLSSLGETLTLQNAAGLTVSTYTYPGHPSPAQRFLAIAALGYAPGDGDAEFIELVNLSAIDTLDLTGVHFTKGVDFSFTSSEITSLAPGARVLVVRNRAAFQALYGAGKPIAGEFANATRLDNAGENLKLDDASEGTILEFAYSPTLPWPAEGVIVVARPQNGNYGKSPANWRLPVTAGGTPGLAEPTVPFTGTAAELIAYAAGGDPALQIGVETLPGELAPAVVLSFRRALAADGASIAPEVASGLGEGVPWLPDGSHLQKIGESRLGTSAQTLVRYRVTGFGEPARAFARLRVISTN